MAKSASTKTKITLEDGDACLVIKANGMQEVYFPKSAVENDEIASDSIYFLGGLVLLFDSKHPDAVKAQQKVWDLIDEHMQRVKSEP